jgi:hypothetical protein
VALPLLLVFSLMAGLLYWMRPHTGLGKRPQPVPSLKRISLDQSFSHLDILPYTVLSDQKVVRDGRRILRRIIAMPFDADRRQVQATLYQAQLEAVRDEGLSTDLTFIWAIPSPRLLEHRMLYEVLNIVCGRLYHIADGKGLPGKGKPEIVTMVVEMPLGDQPPSRQDLDLAIDAATAIATGKRPGKPINQQALLKDFAARRGVALARVVQAVNRVRSYYPQIPPGEMELGRG